MKARTAHRVLALLTLAAGGALASGGCLPAAPAAPALPAMPEMPSVPASPPPPAAPDAPAVPSVQAPKIPPNVAANCCLRDPAAAQRACGGGVQRCCTEKLERGPCESAGGLWFHETAGCAGAC